MNVTAQLKAKHLGPTLWNIKLGTAVEKCHLNMGSSPGSSTSHELPVNMLWKAVETHFPETCFEKVD